ncbi:4'-phosphopantetheinyl transferase family protein [Micrococcus terreus]|uniref:4'-phosphopantetheinyl transferase family protein n=1 Tax=Micrococcus terreus TaxID=574650 RepID=UPI003D70BB6A
MNADRHHRHEQKDGASTPGAPSWHVVLTGPRTPDQRREALDFLAVSRGFRPGTWDAVHQCPECGSDQHGSPSLRLTSLARRRHGTGLPDDATPVPCVSFSRAGGWLATAWLDPDAAQTGWRIGVDIEVVTGPAFATADGLGPAESSVGFSGAEQQAVAGLPEGQQAAVRATLWAVKEAVVKALGTGFRADPSELTVARTDPATGGLRLEVPDHPEAVVVLGTDWPGGELPEGQVGAVVLLSVG